MSIERYRRIRGSVSVIHYHFVWCPKYRRKVLNGLVAKRLEALLHEKANELYCVIRALEVMPDHVHVFIDCPPTLAPQQIANQLKGYTSRILRAELWSRSYYLGSAGNVSSETIQRYIEQQRRS